MIRSVLSLLLSFLFLFVGHLDAGLPCSSQHTMKPDYGKPQSIADNPPPYKLFVLNSRGETVKYYKDEIYTIVLNGTSYFRAFLIQARISTRQGHVIGFLRAGEFIPDERWSEQGVQIQKCPPIFNDSITNGNIEKKLSIDVRWRARRNDGAIQFVITVIKDHNMFWVKWSPESGLIFPDNDAKFTEQVSLNSKGEIGPETRKGGETKVILSSDAANLTLSKSVNETAGSADEETDIKTEFNGFIRPPPSKDNKKIGPSDTTSQPPIIHQPSTSPPRRPQASKKQDVDTQEPLTDASETEIIDATDDAESSQEKETERSTTIEITTLSTKKPLKVSKINGRVSSQPTTTTTEEPPAVEGEADKDHEVSPSGGSEESDVKIVSTTLVPVPTEVETIPPPTVEIKKSDTTTITKNPTVATTGDVESSSEKEDRETLPAVVAAIETDAPFTETVPHPIPTENVPHPVPTENVPRANLQTADLPKPTISGDLNLSTIVSAIPTTVVPNEAKPVVAARVEEIGSDEAFRTSGEKVTKRPQNITPSPPPPPTKPTEVDYCVDAPCKNNGTCINAPEDKTFVCSCKKPWMGETCAKQNFCVDQPCLHGGNCTNTETNFVCNCTADWTDETCQTPCPTNLCQNGGNCFRKNGDFACNCKKGWTGINCETDINECLSNPCLNDGTCVDKVGGFDCRCIKGYMGERCHRPCQDIYHSCDSWHDEDKCETMKPVTKFFDINCAKTCGQCIFDNETVRTDLPLPPILEPLNYLMGVWSVNQTTPKRFPVDFPDAPQGYYEELKFMVTNISMFGIPYINYTSKAVNLGDLNDIQSNVGFMTLKPLPEGVKVAIMSSGNDGITVIEEGTIKGTEIELTAGYFAFYPSIKKPAKLTRKFLMSGDYLQESVERTSDNGQLDSFTKYYSKKEKLISY